MKKIFFVAVILLLVLGNSFLFAQNNTQRTYHLLILDRTYCTLNSDIGGMNNVEVLYKFNHGANGYLIAIYAYTQDGTVFPQIPANSLVLVNLMTTRKATLNEFINSAAFTRFVTRESIKTGLRESLER